MKRLSVILSAILVLCVSVVFSACGESAKLPAPAYLYMDEDENLNWSEVENARSYEIEIGSTGGDGEVSNRTSRRPGLSLRTLPEGDYTIRVRAVGSGNVYSEWSESIFHEKNSDSGYTYTAFDDGTAWVLMSARSSNGEISVGDTYLGKPIVGIGDGAFRNNQNVTSVTLGQYVRSVGERVFYNCISLKSAVLPDSVLSFGESVFFGCTQLESVKLPAKLTAVPAYTFAYCSALKKVEFPGGVGSIGDSAFYNCTSLEEIVIPDSVESVGQYAFSKDDTLSSVTFGANVRTVGAYAFSENKVLTSLVFAENYGSLEFGAGVFTACPELAECIFPVGTLFVPNYCFDGDGKFEKVTIPESVTDVGLHAFRNTKLAADGEGEWTYADKWLISVPQEIQKTLTELAPENFRDDAEGIAYGVFKTDVSAEDEAQKTGCVVLNSVELPKSVKYIGTAAFFGCPFNKFTVENGSLLESIGTQAFRGCASLYNLQLSYDTVNGYGSNLKSIGDYAFYGCRSLGNNQQNPEWIIPSGVTHVGQRVYDNTPLYENSAQNGVIIAGNWVVGFDEDSGVTMVELGEDVVGIADYSFAYNIGLMSVEGTSHVRYIGEGAFMDCEGLKQVRLNRNVTRIAPFTFAQCISLTDVGEQLPSGIVEIGPYAFFQCDSLQKIDLSATQVEEIGDFAYYSCEAVQNIVLPEGLGKIGDYAFYHNTVREITVPDSVTSIGSHAFTYSENLETLTFGANSKLRSIGDYAFRESPKLRTLALPDSLGTIGYAAFFRCGLTDVVFGSNLEEIGPCAFAFNNLHALNLPRGIRSVGDYAFLCCFGLRSVILPESLQYVGSYAFYGCVDATFYSAAADVPPGWSRRWNSSFRPALWGVTVSEEGYIISIQAEKVTGGMAQGGIAAPVRDGYEFLGWTTQENGAEAEYTMGDLPSIGEDVTLYAVYGPQQAEPQVP